MNSVERVELYIKANFSKSQLLGCYCLHGKPLPWNVLSKNPISFIRAHQQSFNPTKVTLTKKTWTLVPFAKFFLRAQNCFPQCSSSQVRTKIAYSSNFIRTTSLTIIIAPNNSMHSSRSTHIVQCHQIFLNFHMINIATNVSFFQFFTYNGYDLSNECFSTMI